MVVFYTKKLKYLNRWFDTFEIYYQKGDVRIDTTRQVITTSGTEMTVTVGTLNEIRDYIAKLRAEITAV
jgi:oxalate decarboxylase/phosphoglucose isomerase-like protein (cupin superfamily)